MKATKNLFALLLMVFKVAFAGLVAVAVTTVTAEKTGKLFLFIILILAVTSTGASEVIAIDSIIIYDFYMTYLKVNFIKRQNTEIVSKFLIYSRFVWTTERIVVFYAVNQEMEKSPKPAGVNL